MEKKKIFVLGAILIVITIIITFIVFDFLPKEEAPYRYSDDPSTWVEEKDGVKEISIDKVTKGEAHIDEVGQQYDNGDIRTVFDYNGWYKGQYFKRTYYVKDKEKMRINPKMKPSDGIIEGFVVERIEKGTPYIYIFLDEDWKNMVDNTKVYWGALFENEIVFDFNNPVSEGIYLVKVEDDKSRFEEDYSIHSGGIYVGDLREDNSSTIISFY